MKKSTVGRMWVAEDVMNTDVLSVGEDMSVQELATFLTENEISGAPVVNAEGKLVGVVSQTDIAEMDRVSARIVPGASNPEFSVRSFDQKLDFEDLREVHIEDQDQLVRDIMTPTVFTVPPDTPVSQIAKTMMAGHVHRLFVTRDGKIAGIITTLDLLQVLAEEE